MKMNEIFLNENTSFLLISYVMLCFVVSFQIRDMKVGNQAAYLALGITKDIVYQWEHGMTGTPAHHEFIKKVKQFCATYREGLMQDGQINPVTGIFWQKNYDGLKDTQDLVLTPNTQRLSDGDYQEIAEKYKQLPTMGDDE